MQSMLNLNSSFGLPLCVSGLTHALSLSQEMVDHDRRRRAMKRMRSRLRRRSDAVGEPAAATTTRGSIPEGGDLSGDLADLLSELAFESCSSSCFTPCTAKAA